LQIAFAILFLGLAVRLVELQVLEGERWARAARELRTRFETIPAARGTFFDRNGTPLVEDDSVYRLAIRAIYLWRGTPSGNLVSFLEAVRRTLPDETRPPRLRVVDVLEEPRACVDFLLDGITKESILAIPRRSERYELYRRLAHLFELADRSEFVRALVQAPGGASLRVILAGGSGGAAPLNPAPERTAVAALETERRRLEDLALRCGTPLGDLLEAVQAHFERVWRQVDRAVEREVRRAEAEGRDTEVAAGYAIDRALGDYPYREQVIVPRIDADGALHLFLEEESLAGFVVREDRERRPSPGVPILLVGWLRDLESDEIEEARSRLRDAARTAASDPRELEWLDHLAGFDPERPPRVGETGLERALETVLAGRDGRVRILRDFLGKEEEVVEYQPAQNGCDVTLTLDLRLQAETERILAEAVGPRKTGSAILMDPRTGEILALAGHPAPDASSFRESYDVWLSDPRRPLARRGIECPDAPFPGSTFKIVSAVAALEEGVVDPDTTFRCYRCMHPEAPDRFGCLGLHGDIALEDAMIRSCNVYFYHAGEKLGGTALADWARRFGFGERTGVEIPEEDAGRVWSPATRRPWHRGDARHLAIGQVNVEVTPLQVLRMVSAVGNGGRLVRPTLVADGGGSDTRRDGVARDLGISRSTLDLVRGALRRVVTDDGGTAHGKGLGRFRAAGKTGTAETGGDRLTHAWFAGYAPSNQPEIAVVVCLEYDGGHGGETAAPVAARLLEAYASLLGFENPTEGN